MPGDECRICGAEERSRLQDHRVVPRRYGGRDRPENLVTLCRRCRDAVESIYDERFYQRLGLETGSREVALADLASVFEAEDGDLIYSEVYNHFFAVEAVDSGWRGRRLELFPVPDQREGVDPPPSMTLYDQEDREREIQQGPVARVERVEGDLLGTLKQYIDRRRD